MELSRRVATGSLIANWGRWGPDVRSGRSAGPAEERRWTFLLTVAPWLIGTTASPVKPLALF